MVDGTQACQFLAASGKGQVRIVRLLGRNRKAGVVLGKVFQQPGICISSETFGTPVNQEECHANPPRWVSHPGVLTC
jgi:hypothetical protein